MNSPKQGYNHVETRQAELKNDNLVKLCKFYDLSADYLVGLTPKPKSYK